MWFYLPSLILTCRQVGRYNIKTKLPGFGACRRYHIPPAIFDLDL